MAATGQKYSEWKMPRFFLYKKAVKYCSKNIFRLKSFFSLAIILMVIELLAVSIFSFLLMAAIRGAVEYVGVFVAVVVVNAVLIFPGLVILIHLHRTTVDKLTKITSTVNLEFIVLFSHECFSDLSSEEAIELVKLLIENKHIGDSRILRDSIIVKNSIELTDDEIDSYLGIEPRASKGEAVHSGKAAKRIVYELPETEEDTNCDNCGRPFESDDTFCRYCGTMRKDLRRRI